MAVIAVAPLVLKDVVMSFGTDDYAKHVDSVTFTPSANTLSWTGLGGNTHTDVQTATWTCTLNYAQDWTTANSLSAFLFENEGEHVPATFKPQSGAGPSFTATLIVTPGAIGGAVNAYATASVTLGIDGRPALVPAA